MIRQDLEKADYVRVDYAKADGSISTYTLTKRHAPEFTAKTGRVMPALSESLVLAYCVEKKSYINLKVENILRYVYIVGENPEGPVTLRELEKAGCELGGIF